MAGAPFLAALTALVPDALVAAMPPSVASAPGSTEKNRPVSRKCSLSCLRVTPGCTARHSMGGHSTASDCIAQHSKCLMKPHTAKRQNNNMRKTKQQRLCAGHLSVGLWLCQAPSPRVVEALVPVT